MALVERWPLWGGREHNMFTVLYSCLLPQNGNPVIYNIKYSDRNLHQKVEVLNENVNVTKQQGSQHLLKYVCIIANNMLTAAV